MATNHSLEHPENRGNVPAPTSEQAAWLAQHLPAQDMLWPGDRVETRRRMSTSGRTLRPGERGTLVKFEGPYDDEDDAHRYTLVIKWDNLRCPAMLDAYYEPGPEPEDELDKLRALVLAARASQIGPQKFTDEYRAFPYQVRLVGRR